jgi:YesN/AraC family two-component response regulator
MRKVVFIDDEKVTLKLLSRIVDWEKEGFTVSGSASDGLEGLELCNAVKPDVIIADIRMPQMDGLTFIREIRKTNAAVKLIILSALDEFEYAQRAIPLGVSAYLLKPLDEDSLLKVLGEIRKELEERNQQDMVAVELDFRKFLDAVENGYKREYTGLLEEKLEKLNQFFKSYMALYLVFSPEEAGTAAPGKNKELAERLIEGIKGGFPTRIFSTDNIINKYTIILIFETGREAEASRASLLEFLKGHRLEDEAAGSAEYRIGISEIFHSASNLKQAYDQAVVACSLSFYPDTPKVNLFEELNGFSLFPEKRLLTNENKIYSCVHTGESKEILEYLDDSFTYFREQRVLPASVYDYCMKCLLMIKRELARYYPSFDMDRLPPLQLEQLKELPDCLRLLSYFKSVLNEITDDIRVFRENDKNRFLIEKGKAYLEENYMRKDFSIQDISDYLGVSKNHFSRLFKETTGQGLWEYVGSLRIEQAKRLLKESNKTNFEISHLIGYESEYHFSRKFKELVGLSPNHYRKLQ